MNNSELKTLIRSQKPNHTLDQKFYTDDDIFELDLKNIFSKQWVFVGHISRIPNHGDYFLFNIGKESIIIIRDNNNSVHAHYNVCRHRGSQICLENEGNSKVLICPYHAWTYNLDGSLKGARLMGKGFNKKDDLNAVQYYDFNGNRVREDSLFTVQNPFEDSLSSSPSSIASTFIFFCFARAGSFLIHSFLSICP